MRNRALAIAIVILAGLGIMGTSGAADRDVQLSALEAGPDAAAACTLGARAKSPGMCAWSRAAKAAGESEKSGAPAPLRLAKGMECPASSGSYCSDTTSQCCYSSSRGYYCAKSLSDC